MSLFSDDLESVMSNDLIFDKAVAKRQATDDARAAADAARSTAFQLNFGDDANEDSVATILDFISSCGNSELDKNITEFMLNVDKTKMRNFYRLLYFAADAVDLAKNSTGVSDSDLGAKFREFASRLDGVDL